MSRFNTNFIFGKTKNVFYNLVSGYLCICADGYIEAVDGKCVDKNECNTGTSPCLAGLACVNNIGSYSCVCENLGYSHYPVPEFNQTFHYGMHSKRDAVDSVRETIPINSEPFDSDEPDLLGDIRFTRRQYNAFTKKGVYIPDKFVDKNPSLERSVIGNKARGADAMANLWKNDFDETIGKYQLPWTFDLDYPEAWRPYVRAALTEYEKQSLK